MYYTYVIKSLKNSRYYTGSTDNLKRRLFEHNRGKSKYTSLTKPFELIYFEKHTTRKDAIKKELFLKTGRGREFLKKQISKRV